MSARAIGVDFGTSFLTVVSGRLKSGTWVLERAIRLPLHEGPAEPEESALVEAAAEALGDMGLARGAAVLGVSGREVMLRYTRAPAMSLYQLKNLMAYEVAEIAEKAGGDVAADYSILHFSEDGGGEATILVGLVKNHYLEPRLEVVRAAGLDVRFSCPGPVALFAAADRFATLRRGETTLVVDIGSDNIDLSLHSEGELVFGRSLALGGRAFTEAAAGSLGLGFGKAEQVKKTRANVAVRSAGGGVDQQTEKISLAMAGVCGQLLGALQSSLLFARNQTGFDVKLDRVVLAGGGAALGGLPEFLEANLEIPVRRFELGPEVDASQLPSGEREAVEESPHEYVSALGLLRVATEPSAFRLEILTATERRKKRLRERTSFLVLAGVVGVVFLLYKAWVGGEMLERQTRRTKELRQVERKRLDDAAKYEENLDETTELAAKTNVLADLTSPGTALGLALDAVQDHLPPDLWLETIDVSLRDVEVVTEGDDDPGRESSRGSSAGGRSSRSGSDPSKKSDKVRLPVVQITGQGRESAEDVQKIVNDFARSLRSDERVVASRLRYNPRTRGFEIDLEFYGERPEDPSGTAAVDDDEEGSR